MADDSLEYNVNIRGIDKAIKDFNDLAKQVKEAAGVFEDLRKAESALTEAVNAVVDAMNDEDTALALLAREKAKRTRDSIAAVA